MGPILKPDAAFRDFLPACREPLSHCMVILGQSGLATTSTGDSTATPAVAVVRHAIRRRMKPYSMRRHPSACPYHARDAGLPLSWT